MLYSLYLVLPIGERRWTDGRSRRLRIQWIGFERHLKLFFTSLYLLTAMK